MKILKKLFGRTTTESSSSTTTETAARPKWEVQRIGLSSVYYIAIGIEAPHLFDVLLSGFDGRIFFATAEEAQAVIGHGHWAIKVGGVDTDLHWTHISGAQMKRRSGVFGETFRLDKSHPDERYGTIKVSLVSSLHAKVVLVAGRNGEDDDVAWDQAKTVLTSSLFDELTVLWVDLTDQARMHKISAGYAG